jgi:hypothetical protein
MLILLDLAPAQAKMLMPEDSPWNAGDGAFGMSGVVLGPRWCRDSHPWIGHDLRLGSSKMSSIKKDSLIASAMGLRTISANGWCDAGLDTSNKTT